MKKGSMLKICVFLFILLLSFSLVNAANENKICKKECTNNRLLDNQNCQSEYESCRKECINNRKCINSCYNEKKECQKETSSSYLKCSKKCSFLGKNITCWGKYNAGDSFLSGCQICECKYNSRISCKKTNFCNFKEVLDDKNTCETNNGLYQQLCNGPYFDIVCSQANFCLCDGSNKYNCPENYYCLHDFSLSLTRRGFTILGWKTLLGAPLGDIGICVKKPVLESCGNGICDNIVSEGKEAETILNCPIDCK